MNIDSLCSQHQDQPEVGHRCATCARIRTELKIVRKTASTLIRAGYAISVHDGEEVVLKRSRKVTDIMGVVFTTDEDNFFVYPKDSEQASFVRFIYGNDGWDVINDYGTSLEAVMAPVNAYCDSLDVYR